MSTLLICCRAALDTSFVYRPRGPMSRRNQWSFSHRNRTSSDRISSGDSSQLTIWNFVFWYFFLVLFRYFLKQNWNDMIFWYYFGTYFLKQNGCNWRPEISFCRVLTFFKTKQWYNSSLENLKAVANTHKVQNFPDLLRKIPLLTIRNFNNFPQIMLFFKST